MHGREGMDGAVSISSGWSLFLLHTPHSSLFLSLPAGSGSTYIYGHVDEAFKENMTREECQAFVKKGDSSPPSLPPSLPPKMLTRQSPPPSLPPAISHAMARDGSSGGVIRMVTIDKSGVSREFIPGKEGGRRGGKACYVYGYVESKEGRRG